MSFLDQIKNKPKLKKVDSVEKKKELSDKPVGGNSFLDQIKKGVTLHEVDVDAEKEKKDCETVTSSSTKSARSVATSQVNEIKVSMVQQCFTNDVMCSSASRSSIC